jgi:hypothetical protein
MNELFFLLYKCLFAKGYKKYKTTNKNLSACC